jgi:hypothetical protein
VVENFIAIALLDSFQEQLQAFREAATRCGNHGRNLTSLNVDVMVRVWL